MIKRYEGNTGRVRRIEESAPAPAQRPASPQPPAPPPPRPVGADWTQRLSRLLPRGLEGLETEDLLLMLILYLLYRDSGDSEWLLILGAMLIS